MRLLVSTLLFCLLALPLSAMSIAVIPVHTGGGAADAAADGAAYRAKKVCTRLGRYIPVGDLSIKKATSILAGKARDSLTAGDIAAATEADLTLIISVVQEGNASIAAIDMIKKSSSEYKRTNLRSKILSMIPLQVEREVILLHEKIPLECTIRSILPDRSMIITAGEFHGLRQGKSYTSDRAGKVTVIESSQYESHVTAENDCNPGDRMVFQIFTDCASERDRINREIHEQIVRRYGSEHTVMAGIPDPEKRFLEGVLVVNMGGDILLPGYGAYLSTFYMGFKDPKPAYSGMALAVGVELTQLLMVPVMTNGRGSLLENIFPISGSGKNENQLRLHQYLWATIPFTFAVAYCDQLAYQYHQMRVLPPLFMNEDRSAVILSLLVPGGGFFYKGYREIGWGYYLTELSLGGYAFYRKGDRRGDIALWSLAGVKAIEMVSAFIAPVNYQFYRDEYNRPSSARLEISVLPDERGDLVYNLGAGIKY
jgi:hypothetical protein